MKDRTLRAIRRLEAQLPAASPADAGRIAKKLVKLKDAWSQDQKPGSSQSGT